MFMYTERLEWWLKMKGGCQVETPACSQNIVTYSYVKCEIMSTYFPVVVLMSKILSCRYNIINVQ